MFSDQSKCGGHVREYSQWLKNGTTSNSAARKAAKTANSPPDSRASRPNSASSRVSRPAILARQPAMKRPEQARAGHWRSRAAISGSDRPGARALTRRRQSGGLGGSQGQSGGGSQGEGFIGSQGSGSDELIQDRDSPRLARLIVCQRNRRRRFRAAGPGRARGTGQSDRHRPIATESDLRRPGRQQQLLTRLPLSGAPRFPRERGASFMPACFSRNARLALDPRREARPRQDSVNDKRPSADTCPSRRACSYGARFANGLATAMSASVIRVADQIAALAPARLSRDNPGSAAGR